jgi:hypothetical protein
MFLKCGYDMREWAYVYDRLFMGRNLHFEILFYRFIARKEQKYLSSITQNTSGTYKKPEHESGMKNNCIAVTNTVTTKSQKWF